jgi:hypothetical protein
MKLIKWILILCINWIVAWIAIFGITLGIAFVIDLMYPNITDAELLTKQNLIKAYEIGAIAGVITFIILQPIYKIIGDYVWNWKKKHTVRLIFDDGGDVEESLSNARRRKELD